MSFFSRPLVVTLTLLSIVASLNGCTLTIDSNSDGKGDNSFTFNTKNLSCNNGEDQKQGNITKYPSGVVKSLKVSTSVNVEVLSGEDNSISISGGVKDIANIDAELSNQTINIGHKSNTCTSNPVTVVVTLNQSTKLTDIFSYTSANLKINSATTLSDNLNIEANTLGQITANSNNLNNLKINSDTSGFVMVNSIAVQSVELNASTAGKIKLNATSIVTGNLKTDTAASIITSKIDKVNSASANTASSINTNGSVITNKNADISSSID